MPGSHPTQCAPHSRGMRLAKALARFVLVLLPVWLAGAQPLAAFQRDQTPGEERVVLITGSTDGLGREVARRMAATGAHVIIHGRNAERGLELVAEIAEAGIGSARFYAADFASLEAVRELAAAILRDYDRLDVLINNAGIGPGAPGEGRRLSSEGNELRFQVNYLAGFLLTRLLVPLLKESAPARVINVSSRSQQPIDFDDIAFERGYAGGVAYGRSKLAQILFTFDLAEELAGSGVSVNAVHPAPAMDTGLVRQTGAQPQSTIADGVRSVLLQLSLPDSVTGRYFHQTEQARAHEQAYDRAARERLRTLSFALTGLR